MTRREVGKTLFGFGALLAFISLFLEITLPAGKVVVISVVSIGAAMWSFQLNIRDIGTAEFFREAGPWMIATGLAGLVVYRFWETADISLGKGICTALLLFGICFSTLSLKGLLKNHWRYERKHA